MRPARRGRQGGHTLLETTLVLGILALLACVGIAATNLGRPSLAFLTGELRGTVDQAALLARARGRNVRMALHEPGRDVPCVPLPRSVRWGMPAGGLPTLPPKMGPTVKARLTGFSHPFVTLTPRGTASAGCWFLTDGRDALCLRLNDQGRLRIWRWRRGGGPWVEV